MTVTTGNAMTLGRRTLLASFASVFALVPLRGVAFAQDMTKPGRDASYRDPRLPVDQRVEDLLGRMTLEEKVGQMIGVWEGKGAIRTRQAISTQPRRRRPSRTDSDRYRVHRTSVASIQP